MSEIIALESPQATLNRARFAGKDFFTFVDDLVTRIQVLYVTEFNDFVVSGTGQMLIDIVSWAAETLSFYIDRQASESYLSTAKTRKAVNRLCRQLGYKMHGAIPASVDLSVNLSAIHAVDRTIPIGFQWSGPSGLIFETTEAVTFPAGEGPASPARTVALSEGASRTENFVSNGQKNQIIRLNPGEGKHVAQGTVAVIVGGVPWTIVDLITFDQTNQVEVDFNSDPTTIRFGDGVAGNVPASGTSIVVTYRATSGLAGLVGSGTITRVVTPLVSGFVEIGLVATNASPSAGADDPESLDSAKVNAPRWFKARGVAVTQEDYVGLSQAYADPLAGAVAVAQAFVARSADEDIQLQILLDNIRAIMTPLRANVQAETATARAQAATAESQRSVINTSIGTLESQLDAIAANPLDPSATGHIIDIRAEAETLRADVNDCDALADEGIVAATTGAKDTRFNSIKAELATMNARLNTILSKAMSIETAISTAGGDVAEISAALTTQQAAIAAIKVDLDDIDALVDAQFETAIETELEAIFGHVDSFLSADCQANLIEVPILTRNADGFLSAPPIALMRSLQSYLEARCEVTQVPNVVSGAPFLVGAVITGTIGIASGYVQATVLSNVRKAIDDLLRVRKFGVSLRQSDLYNKVMAVAGVQWAVIKITGPAEYLNVDGDLIITKQYVITKGTVTVTGVTA